MALPFLHQQAYPITIACRVAGVSINTFRTWVKRGNISFSKTEMERANRAGEPHRLTYDTVIRIAIMGDLVSYGMNPSRAWAAAFTFTDAGEFESSGRKPGGLYEQGQTWLVVPRSGDAHLMRLDLGHPTDLAVKAPRAIVIYMNDLIEALDKDLAELTERSAA